MHIFYHIYQAPGWEDILGEQVDLIQTSGLYDEVDSIKVSVIGDTELFLPEKYEIVYQDTNNTFELRTIEALHKFSKTVDNTPILYMHTKGVTTRSTKTRDWRHLMEYFCITKFKDAVATLNNGYEVVGVNFIEKPSPHFSGNFWWANSDYLSTLPDVDFSTRMNAEFWVCSNNPKYNCLYHSGVDHYRTAFPRALYEA